LLASGLIEPTGIVVDAKSGVSGAGRGGRSEFGFAETNEDVMPYGLEKHVHVPEMCEALTRVQSGPVTVPSQSSAARVTIAFTPHLIPMTRGIVSTTYGRPVGTPSIDAIFSAAEAMYANEPFVKVVRPTNGRGPHSTWTTGSNLCFVTYSVNQVTGHIVAIGVIDNLGKGAAGQAIQNANLMTGQAETAGLMGLPLSP
jgi:N-acetyl-gamma-glutamyl-phosphate reductase